MRAGSIVFFPAFLPSLEDFPRRCKSRVGKNKKGRTPLARPLLPTIGGSFVSRIGPFPDPEASG
jgi:hypothetical protein